MDIYDEMMNSARNISVSFPDPLFYKTFAPELTESRRIYEQARLVARCRRIVTEDLALNPSHGLDHAEKVAVEAGALVLEEGAKIGLKDSDADEVVILAHVAGLLHDMRRGDKNHANSGASAAGLLLDILGVPERDRQYVVQAISNHEAFIKPQPIVSPIGKLLSDALYDADKFRWGPDNFMVTLWEMLRFSGRT